jgi:Cu-Zn family superoxide dismutase
MNNAHRAALALTAVSFASVALAQSPSPAAGGGKKPTRAVAVLQPTQGSSVSGTVWFTQGAGGITVKASVKGLSAGQHGFHVHEFGDCTAPDATSAGGHFNPDSQPHGAPTDAKRHAGDLGNVTAAADGTASLDWTDKDMHLTGAEGVVGHAVIVHANADDLKTQPTGNAGGRVACGVIGVAKGE